jgi:hypothetical protein
VSFERGWLRTFDEPILLAKGRRLVTLKDAGADQMQGVLARIEMVCATVAAALWDIAMWSSCF